jgi:hypothetical protein
MPLVAILYVELHIEDMADQLLFVCADIDI